MINILTYLWPKKTVKTGGFLDEKWYDRFVRIGSFQAYKYFDGNLNYRWREFRAFVSDKKRNPVFDYPKIDQEYFQNIKTELIGLKTEIQEKEKNQLVKKVYIEKIDEKLLEIKLLFASLGMSNAKTMTEKKVQAQKFQKFTEKLYGRPTRKIFGFTVNKILAIAKKYLGKNKYIDAAAVDLINVLPQVDEKISTEVLEKSHLEKIFIKDKLIAVDPKNLFRANAKKLLSATEIKSYFVKYLDNLKITDWKVALQRNISHISIDHEKKEVSIPYLRKMVPGRLRFLLVHEILVHVQRRVNGEKSKLKILGLGLSGYEAGEEGLAGVCEDILKKSVDVTLNSLIGYMAVGLAVGIDGQKRDFRELFDVLLVYYRFKFIKNCRDFSDLSLLKIDYRSKIQAWHAAMRIFRGTSCDVAGVCFTKDLIYLKGRLCIWDQIRCRSKEMDRFFCGKYDPCNLEHTKILDELGL